MQDILLIAIPALFTAAMFLFQHLSSDENKDASAKKRVKRATLWIGLLSVIFGVLVQIANDKRSESRSTAMKTQLDSLDISNTRLLGMVLDGFQNAPTDKGMRSLFAENREFLIGQLQRKPIQVTPKVTPRVASENPVVPTTAGNQIIETPTYFTTSPIFASSPVVSGDDIFSRTRITGFSDSSIFVNHPSTRFGNSKIMENILNTRNEDVENILAEPLYVDRVPGSMPKITEGNFSFSADELKRIHLVVDRPTCKPETAHSTDGASDQYCLNISGILSGTKTRNGDKLVWMTYGSFTQVGSSLQSTQISCECEAE